MEESRSGGRGHEHPTLEVQMTIVVVPVGESGAKEEGSAILQSSEDVQNKGVRRGRLRDGCGEGEVEGINDDRIRDNRGVLVVESGILGIFSREGISRAHLSPGSDYPFDVEVLQEEGPSCLSTRKFSGVFDVGEIFVISDDRDGKGSSL